MPSPLSLEVFVVPYKPIVGVVPPMGDGEPTWPATSVSLISGERDAVLVDAVLPPEDAGRVVDWIRATGKNLTTVYITHGHGDHFFGLNTILAAFPDARAVTAAGVIPEAQRQLSPAHMAFWNAIFPGQIRSTRSARSPRRRRDRPRGPGAAHHHGRAGRHRSFDDRPHPEPGCRHRRRRRLNGSTSGWHRPTTRSDCSGSRASSRSRRSSPDRGRRAQGPDARDDDPATILGDTKAYIRDFDRSLAESHSPQELVDRMMVLHGELGNPYTLWTAAQGVFRGAPTRCLTSRNRDPGPRWPGTVEPTRQRLGAPDPGRRALDAQGSGGSPRRRRRHGESAPGASVAPSIRCSGQAQLRSPPSASR